jgi:hypothetical protein
MAVSASTLLGISKAEFDATGAFDPILDVDSRLFIDPLLLRASTELEFLEVRDTIDRRFGELYKLLAKARFEGDIYWRAADERFRFPEVRGLCIGYTSHGTGGNGMGAELRARTLQTAREIIDSGIDDPIFFELLGVLQPGIGPDRISDMFARIASDEIGRYSTRVFAELGRSDGRSLPRNPANGDPILLVPRDILRDLPLASSWDEVESMIAHNAQLRAEVNALIGDNWQKERRRGQKKAALRQALRSSPYVMRRFLNAYRDADVRPYDFDRDPRGRVVWYEATRSAASAAPMLLALGSAPTPGDILGVVLQICNRFRELVENNKLSALLYEADGRPKHEEAAQLLLYGIADAYCDANDLDLSREPNAGRGSVDFKLSGGRRTMVLVETKLDTNPNLVHGFETQLAEYQLAERAAETVYVVIDVGGPESRIPDLKEAIREAGSAGAQVPTLVLVDGKPRAPASRYRRTREPE